MTLLKLDKLRQFLDSLPGSMTFQPSHLADTRGLVGDGRIHTSLCSGADPEIRAGPRQLGRLVGLGSALLSICLILHPHIYFPVVRVRKEGKSGSCRAHVAVPSSLAKEDRKRGGREAVSQPKRGPSPGIRAPRRHRCLAPVQSLRMYQVYRRKGALGVIKTVRDLLARPFFPFNTSAMPRALRVSLADGNASCGCLAYHQARFI
ncbi:hypothetical protein B0T16DRAFT_106137 [Cercophora newfieldiana]|uniref:Uncharacterized protein n=1 Tax=Cercophora newfieldiana TaxID=92897 RepID=A0AA39YIA9_9PEZI|nr:hypothetical protein B0T16DRAFT_106137 [Cercophora newfieldiana]